MKQKIEMIMALLLLIIWVVVEPILYLRQVYSVQTLKLTPEQNQQVVKKWENLDVENLRHEAITQFISSDNVINSFQKERIKMALLWSAHAVVTTLFVIFFAMFIFNRTLCLKSEDRIQ